jgi:hypothetical protein
MRMFLPYWETTGNVPFDPAGRMERYRHNLGASCSTLYLKNLPEDITKRVTFMNECLLTTLGIDFPFQFLAKFL